MRRPPRSTQGVSSAASDGYKRQVKDLGYEITDNDEIEFELNIPEHEVLGISNLGDYLVSSAQWVMGLKDEYIPKRELSKILIEFFQEIKDERE